MNNVSINIIAKIILSNITNLTEPCSSQKRKLLIHLLKLRLIHTDNFIV